MSAIAASNVTHTIIGKQTKLENGYKKNLATIAFGNGSLTYPTGGVQLTKGHLGCPVLLNEILVVDSHSDGYVYKFDRANQKLLMFQAPGSAAALAELSSSATPTVSIIVEAVGY